MKIYTKTGDKGETSLYGGSRVSKSSCDIEALGNLDELNAYLGVVDAVCSHKDIKKILFKIQNELFSIGAEVAMNKSQVKSSKKTFKLGKSEVSSIEKSIDSYEAKLLKLTSFILPGGSVLSSHFQYARAVCRRTERSLVALSEVSTLNRNILSYINRVSDLLFVLARYSNKLENCEDVKWKS